MKTNLASFFKNNSIQIKFILFSLIVVGFLIVPVFQEVKAQSCSYDGCSWEYWKDTCEGDTFCEYYQNEGTYDRPYTRMDCSSGTCVEVSECYRNTCSGTSSSCNTAPGNCGGGGGEPTPSTFSVAMDPLLRTIYPGDTTTYNITITPSSYTGTVNLDNVGSCPANAACSFSPTSATFVSTDTTAKTSTLIISNTSSLVVQNYTITARGIDTAPDPDLVYSASASLEVIARPPNQAICDGAWHQMPGGGNTPSQPVGIQLGSVYSDKIGFVIRGTDNQTYYRTCDFSGSECYLNNNWTGIGGSPYYSPRTFFGADWDFNNKYSDKTYWSKFFHSIPINTWSNWTYVSTGDEPWGTPYRFNDRLGRTWQLQRKADTTIEYACGANLPCITPAFDASKSSVSPTTVNINDNVTIRCDMSVMGMAGIAPYFTGGQFVSDDGYDVTTAKFTFKATQPGTHIVSCNTSVTGQNFCASSNTAGTLIVNLAVNNPPTANAGNNQIITGTISNPVVGASASDSDGTISSTVWSFVSGPGPTPTITNGSTLAPTFGGMISVGDYFFRLTATDNLGATGFAQMWVRVNAGTNDLCITKSGLGTVGRNPSGTPSIPNCWSYVSGTNVVLTATPATGRIFTGWGGACAGVSRTSNCTVNMNGPKTVIVNFAIDPNYREF